MNVDDMTDEEFIDYCRNGGELYAASQPGHEPAGS